MLIESSAGWAWGKLAKPVTDLAIAAAKKGVTKGADQVVKSASSMWQKIKWEEAELKYRQKLLDLVRTTKVLGNPTSIEIERIYTDVFVFDKLSAIRRYSESLDEDEIDVRGKLDDRPRINAKSLLLNGKNTFILGRPGAGKTTFMKYLAMSACKGLMVNTPIFVPLKDWSDSSLPLMEYIAKQFEICSFPNASLFLEAVFSEGKALVLLDGLDEVNEWQDKRNQLIKDIVNFSNKYQKNQYCLTCRTAATDYSFDRFQYVEVADFNDEQQEQFASQWYGRNTPMLEKFLAAWKSPRNAGFRELGRTPLLLTLLCLAFDETHSFPRRQVDLYQEAINALLKKWDTSRLITRDVFYRELSFGQRQQLLETIASDFYFNSRTVFRKNEVAEVARKFVDSLPNIDLHAPVDGQEVVRQIEAQHGLLVEKAHGLYTFSHLTVQEYFTASYISKNQNANLQKQIVKSALNDQKWREVMLYTVALLSQADSLLEEMKRQIVSMKVASSGVLIFLAHCYCDSRLKAVGHRLKPDSPEYFLFGVRAQIDAYLSELSQPSLTGAELAKFAEHIEVLNDFLKARTGKSEYDLSAGVVSAALHFLKQGPLDAARLLGGYFIKPEQFVSFFYACRLFMECLEVAITPKRASYLTELFTLDQRDFERVAQVVGH